MSLEELVKTHFYTFAGRMYKSPDDDTIWVALEKERAIGVGSEREYPSIDILSKDAIVSEPLNICKRVSEYGYIEKYFSRPHWNKDYIDITQSHELDDLKFAAEDM